jgi:hypothetical protein
VYLFSQFVTAFLLFTATALPAPAQPSVFPELKAQNLEGKILSLPGEFSGDLNLVLIAFERDQQREVDSWLEAQPEIFKGHPGIPCYEISTMGKEYKMARFLIDRSLRYGISNQEQRARTFTLYIDKAPFEQSMHITNERRIAVLLVDRKGKVMWREEGLYYDIKGNSLKNALSASSH